MIAFRIAALLLGLSLAACAEQTPEQPFAPLSYDYLTKLRLDAGSVAIDDSWVPRGDARHVEYLAPTPPLAALRQMAQDRLIAGGTAGHADFVIDDASIVQVEDHYEGDFAVHVNVLGDDGAPRATATARVHAIHPMTGDDPDTVRADLYDFTSRLMNAMNVEFEFQVTHNMANVLQSTSPNAPMPDVVNSQDLAAPAKQP